MRPLNLRCEYLKNPLGIDVERPRLSWELERDDIDAHDEVQQAYRILVASEPGTLHRLEADVWDSGRVESGATSQVVYGGRLLGAHERVYWAVLVWDADGRVTDSLGDGDVALWQTGFTGRDKWRAEWIGPENEEFHLVKVFDHARGKEVEVLQGPPCPMFRREFVLRGGVKRATLYSTALGEYEVRLNGARVGDEYLAPEWTDYSKRLLYQTHDVTGLV
ncbi:MAG: glycoside hydrolase family 78 protein, partial [Promethearchaeota archaeon]